MLIYRVYAGVLLIECEPATGTSYHTDDDPKDRGQSDLFQ